MITAFASATASASASSASASDSAPMILYSENFDRRAQPVAGADT